ncbi:type VI secretion system-associated FHA domain protein TagH [uncultured Sphaerotilus sp.]|uniref:type VI secretion system-associated FHA domain protein TagH n=1 Tax=uncultured Sphaerotilus sp. TaxID=474984 RepID=UPI0030CA37A8
MRLLIRAVSLAGQPLTQPITGIFDDRVGTIGRAETCTLMLPDPERHISRVQAEVSRDERGYSVRNVSHANPIVVNGRPVPSGRSVLLSDGDDLQIGSYLLRISRTSQVTAASAAVPSVADVTRTSPPPTTSPPPAPAFVPAPTPAPPPAPETASDPFAALWAPPTPGKGSAALSARSPFDDLGGFESAAPGPAPVALPSGFDLGTDLGLDPGGGFGAGRGQPSAGLDDLFGLGPSVKGSDAVDDFLRVAPANPAPPPPRADRTPELNGSMPLPQARSAPPSGSGLTQLLGDVKSWGLPAGPVAPTAPVPPVAPVAPVAPAMPLASAPMPTPMPTTPSGADPLWTAFCEGAGIGLQLPGGLTPALMRVIGQMLRRSVDGTVQLVAARATTKAELHAQVTMIQPRNNNPLKFSPDGRMALEQLLQPPLRGFLAGPEAIDQAMDDLVGHAVGTMAGMRAALDGVLDRFAPDQLEAKLTRQSVFDSVLPMHRRARLWELYLQHFQSVSDDAKDDFHSLFGKAFLQAYEEQLDRLDASRQPGTQPDRLAGGS